ncbi:MAG TPA: hypothetical protein VFG50_16035 [Rhodothermales bacterium]|nr:hypothetical protein [Rhodothermales bacterium]
MKRIAPVVAVFACAGLLAACDSGPDYHRYPAPLRLQAVSVTALRTTAEVPGRYNVTGTIVKVTTCDCPPDLRCSLCAFPNGIIISETGAPLQPGDYHSGDATSYLLIEAEDPEQFKAGERYVFSVEVTPTYAQQRPVYQAELLGYGLPE